MNQPTTRQEAQRAITRWVISKTWEALRTSTKEANGSYLINAANIEHMQAHALEDINRTHKKESSND